MSSMKKTFIISVCLRLDEEIAKYNTFRTKWKICQSCCFVKTNKCKNKIFKFIWTIPTGTNFTRWNNEAEWTRSWSTSQFTSSHARGRYLWHWLQKSFRYTIFVLPVQHLSSIEFMISLDFSWIAIKAKINIVNKKKCATLN